jgi:PKHD-type hydroxylase
MVFLKRKALNKKQCDFIIEAAAKKGFIEASVRNRDGVSFIDKNHRGCKVAFLKQEHIPGAWEKVIQIIEDVNKNNFKIRIDSYDFQLSEYNAGDVGFGWHHDDPMYPTKGVLWSGRKLTTVFELSENNDYEGGLLEVNPYTEASIQDNQEKRMLGDCLIFPSFFKHRVTPITNGKRFSLTVWAKGPVWV